MDISQVVQSRAYGHIRVDGLEVSPEKAKPVAHNKVAQDLSGLDIGSKEKPMQLLMSSVQEKLNDLIASNLGSIANRSTDYSSTPDSPEAVAESVINRFMGFYELFKKQHLGKNDTEVARKYMDIAGLVVDQGFDEARQVLSSLGALNDDTTNRIEKTYTQIQAGLANFKNQIDIQHG